MSYQAMSKRNKATGREFNDPVTIFTVCVTNPCASEVFFCHYKDIADRKNKVYGARSQLYTTSPV